MASQTFEKWLARLRPAVEVEALLRDRAALEFLIAWSMLETTCFSGYMTSQKIQPFAERITRSEAFDTSLIQEPLGHFHARYQNYTYYQNLLYGATSDRMSTLVQKPAADFTQDDAVFFVCYVVYRFRNNIFHGNKGVESWLRYKKQIRLCIGTMQEFVSHSIVMAQKKAA